MIKMESEFNFNFTAVLALFAIFAAFVLFIRRRKRLPPGPKGYPIIGNMTQVNMRDSVKEFERLRKEYGDVFCFKIMQKLHIVVAGREAITDLLVKQADSLSERPDIVFLKIFNMTLGEVFLLGYTTPLVS